MTQNLLYFFAFILFLSCNPAQKTTQTKDIDPTKCQTTGTVKDYSGLDGCTFLIEMENGEKWLPAKMMDENFKLWSGMEIRFGYREIPDAISICMAESKSVEITCIEEVTKGKGKPTVKECYDINEPTEAPWMGELMKKHKVNRISKYTFRDGWAYMIFTNERRLLYDCQGTDLCPVEKSDVAACFTRYLQMLGTSSIIYTGASNR